VRVTSLREAGGGVGGLSTPRAKSLVAGATPSDVAPAAQLPLPLFKRLLLAAT